MAVAPPSAATITTSSVIPYEGDDPLTLALAPPPDETAEQKQQREAAEAEAQRRSDEIDEQIQKERELERRKKRPVKLLLLGQSESGKTATLKNFQLTYARREWTEERLLWKSVIFFNLVRNVNEILDILTQEMSRSATTLADNSSDDSSADESPNVPLKFKETHRLLKLRLGPLRRIQTDLERRLGNAALEVKTTDVMTAAPFGKPAVNEFSINATNGWKTAFDKLKAIRRPEMGALQQTKDEEDEIADVVAGCREDMKAIWEDPVIREMLVRRRDRIEDSPGFFLNDAERIAVRNYQPTDDDIIRARLRTLGVQEYRFIFDHGRTVGQEWRIYDVGGTRSSRVAWYPYFDDVDAIIFLASAGRLLFAFAFAESFPTDRRINRLEDSYLLWKSVCACKLLSRTQIILFLNKCDLLQAKLARGVKIRDSVPSYGDRANNLTMATKYFQQHFREISRQSSPVTRPFYVHMTSVIDTRSTAATLGAVEESILRDHLRRADLM
ncbi:guanine nucleotide binding protein, alpha subunit [Armillaria novae-zelandiae]|uniref:Guanine nucleotide binding protein, alpha subunit n=1 Tax=Armillaria novae-zelandiae TaxID=153914 RepID=A0AA39U8N8_9AGAR|nr:guanine nucleotide binding protein, alpha subunit [Armillaria novae-zelandiae]